LGLAVSFIRARLSADLRLGAAPLGLGLSVAAYPGLPPWAKIYAAPLALEHRKNEILQDLKGINGACSHVLL